MGGVIMANPGSSPGYLSSLVCGSRRVWGWLVGCRYILKNKKKMDWGLEEWCIQFHSHLRDLIFDTIIAECVLFYPALGRGEGWGKDAISATREMDYPESKYVPLFKKIINLFEFFWTSFFWSTKRLKFLKAPKSSPKTLLKTPKNFLRMQGDHSGTYYRPVRAEMGGRAPTCVNA